MSDLVSATELLRWRESRPPLIIDVQFALLGPPSTALYAQGHLPGAPHLSLEDSLAGAPGAGGRHPLPDPAVLERALRECGVHDDSAVVVYDQGSGLSAARAWWVLRWAGLRTVRVLEGGLAAWRALGAEVSTGTSRPHPGTVTVRAGTLLATAIEDVPQMAAAGLLLDVRAPERYRGDMEPIDAIGGHIPGALNLPMHVMMHDDGTFRTPAEIAATASALGLDPSRPVVTSCGSGVTATQMVLALRLAGIDASPFIGSWSAWIADPTLPIRTGGNP